MRRLPWPFLYGPYLMDDVIMPHGTRRRRICRSLAMLRDNQLSNPWKKHDNIPL